LALLACVLAGLLFATRTTAEDVGETVGTSFHLPATPGPHWFWLSDVLLHRTALFDGDSGKLLGTITAGSVGVGFIISPMTAKDHREIYIPESYFSRGVRGDRTDVVSVYDGSTLMPKEEIQIPPKRAEYFPGNAANAMLDDGRFLVVFNVTPAQSATVVDAPGRKFTAEVQSPGCSLVYPAGARRFFMLCADGSALVVTLDDAGAVTSAERTQKFFDPDKDPITDKGARQGNVWHFVSSDGVVHSLDVSGATPTFAETWSLLSDAERKDNWRVGGEQHLAIHQKSERLYVIVHQGGADTHKSPGGEIWVYDLKSHQRLQRIATQNPLVSFIRLQSETNMSGTRGRVISWILEHVLPNTGTDGILVTQDDHPVLVGLSMMPPAVTVYDAMSGQIAREIAEPGLGAGLLVAP
jgi:methylamine dehydrogenase heavy chain